MEEERLKHEKEFLSSQMFFKPSFANGSGPVDFQFGARNLKLGLGPAGCMMLLTKALLFFWETPYWNWGCLRPLRWLQGLRLNCKSQHPSIHNYPKPQSHGYVSGVYRNMGFRGLSFICLQPVKCCQKALMMHFLSPQLWVRALIPDFPEHSCSPWKLQSPQAILNPREDMYPNI